MKIKNKDEILKVLDGKTYDENAIDAIQSSFDKYRKQLDECDRMINNAKSMADYDKARTKINEIKKYFDYEYSKMKDTLWKENVQVSARIQDLMLELRRK